MTNKKRRSSPPPGLRQRAEAALSHTRADIGRMSAEEIQRLVHELQVHQIELQIQNEDLRESQSELARSRDSFNDLYDFAPVGYVTFGADGVILSANLTLATMLGVPRGRLVGSLLAHFVDRASRDLFHLHRNAVLSDHRKHDCELQLMGPGGTTFFARLETIGIADPAGGPPEFGSAIIDISARKKADDALRESEQRFRSMAHSLPLIVWICDPRGEPEFLNEAFREFFGVSTEAMREGGWHQLVPPDQLAAITGELADCLSSRRPFHAEGPARRADGEVRWLESWGQPRYSESGEFLGFVGTSADVTERKQATEEIARINASLEQTIDVRTADLRESEERFRHLVQSLPVAVHTCDAEGRITLFNAAAAELWGRSPEIGKDRWDGARGQFSPDDERLPDDETPVARALRHNQPVRNFEMVIERADHERFHVLAFAEPLHDRAGKLVGVLKVMVDISALKKAEAALQNSARNLRKLTRAVEQSPASVMITDTAAVIEYVNPTFTGITGYSVEEVIGKSASILKSGFHPPEYYREMKETISAGRTWHNEICNRKKNGDLFWELIVIAPIEDEDGKIIHYVSIAEDITDRQRALAELHDREQRLASILNAAVDAIVTLDARGSILSVNPATERIFGYARDELIGLSFDVLVPSSSVEVRDGFPAEVSGKRADGSAFPADLSINEVEELGIQTAIIRDITGKKRAEADQISLGRIVEESINEIYVFNAETFRFLQVNRGGRRNLGYSMEELRGMTPLDLISRGDLGQLRARLDVLLSGENDKIDMRDMFLRKDGSRYHVDVSVQLATYRGEACFVANVLDTTRRHELEQEVVRASEEEQQRIANDLHDDLGSVLTGIKLRAEALTGMLDDRGDDCAGAGGLIVRMIQDAIIKTRSIARGLRPVGSHPEDLMTALRAMATQVDSTPELDCSFHCPDPVLIDDPIISNHLFRIAQEAMNNAIKHSGGSQLALSLGQNGNVVELKVTDDGKGIGRSAEQGGGIGLHIMRYRASAINGSLRIGVMKNGGTRVVCRVAGAGVGPEVS